jgi:hypothetical protein
VRAEHGAPCATPRSSHAASTDPVTPRWAGLAPGDDSFTRSSCGHHTGSDDQQPCVSTKPVDDLITNVKHGRDTPWTTSLDPRQTTRDMRAGHL